MKEVKMMNFAEVMARMDDECFTAEVSEGLTLTADCQTDDEAMLNEEAWFDIRCSWGDGTIGRFDNKRGELDKPIAKLVAAISKKFPEQKWTLGDDWSIVQLGAED